jgi:chromosome segregation ATPase
MNVRSSHALFALGFFLIVTPAIQAVTSPGDLAALLSKAESGNTIAQYNLGLIYADPVESSFDLIQAYVWLSRAATGGSRSRELTLVTERLTANQLREAQNRLESEPTITPGPIKQGNSHENSNQQTETGSQNPPLSDSTLSSAASATTLGQRLATSERTLSIREHDLAKLQSELDAHIALVATNNSPDAIADIQSLRAQLSLVKTESQSTKNELIKIHGELAAAKQDRTKLQSQLIEVSRTKDAALAEVKTLSAIRHQQTGQIEIAHAQTQQLRAAAKEQTTAQQNQLNSLQSQLADAHIASTEATASSTRIADLKHQLAETDQQLDHNRTQSQTQIQELATDLAATRAKFNQLNLRHEADTSKIAQLENQITTLTSNRVYTRGAAETAQVKAAEYDGEIANLDQQLATTKQSITQLERLRTHAEAQNRELANELADTRGQFEQATLRARTDEAKIAHLESQIQVISPELTNTRAAAETALAQATDSSRLLDQMRDQLADTMVHLETTTEELDSLRTSHAKQIQLAQALETENILLRKKVQESDREYPDTMGNLSPLSPDFAPNDAKLRVANTPVRTAPIRPRTLPVTAAFPSGTQRTHTVMTGESLTSIAHRYLGREDRWPQIFALNREKIMSTNAIVSGMVLTIP